MIDRGMGRMKSVRVWQGCAGDECVLVRHFVQKDGNVRFLCEDLHGLEEEIGRIHAGCREKQRVQRCRHATPGGYWQRLQPFSFVLQSQAETPIG